MLLRLRQAGLTILECLLATLIAASFIFLGVTQFKRYEKQEELRTIRANVDQLFQAMNVYYREHCNTEVSQGKTFTVDKIKLEQAGLWPHLRHTNLAPLLGYQINAALLPLQTLSSNEEIYQLYIDVKLKLGNVVDLDTMNFYKRALGAGEINGYSLEWMKLPGYKVPHAHSNLWILNAGLQRFRKSQQQGTGKMCG